MNKSNFQLLAEELEQEINILSKEITMKKRMLTEKAPGPTPSAEGIPPFPSNPNVVPANAGFIAGTYGVNGDVVAKNPNVISAGKKGRGFRDPTPGSDPRTAPYKPHYSNNFGSMLGFGVDDNTFSRTRDFIKQYNITSDALADTDDPAEEVSVSWQKLNNAVSNYNAQRIKDELVKAGLFRQANNQAAFPNALGDQYNVFIPDLALRKKLEDHAKEVMGLSRGREVNSKLAQIQR